ncbi:hypothetical protein [Embleya sp. NPDC050493]|uniref:hypothetical protein n=1 Tax=Embleya sp. NPDC050493 TaxID=3363989 RepID=UPI0037892D1B
MDLKTRTRRLRSGMVAALSATALTVTLATDAQAATGTFTYTDGNTYQQVTYTNPSPDRCITINTWSYDFTNNTNSYAWLYIGTAGCYGTNPVYIAPGETKLGQLTTYAHLKFAV